MASPSPYPIPTGATSAERLGRRLDPRATVAAVAALSGFWFFRFIWNYSVNILFFDQWDYLTPLLRGEGLAQLFLWQHGPHREGVGLIATSLLYRLTNWNTRAEALMIGAAVFAAMLVALALKRRLFGKLEHWDAAIPLLFLTLAQYETFVSVANPGYAGLPLLMVMLYCLALLHRNRLLRYTLTLGLNALLIFTGFGVVMGVITLGVFALECYRNRRRIALPAAGLAVAALSLASFFTNYVFQPAADCFGISWASIAMYPRFVAQMFAGYLEIRNPMLPAACFGGAILLLAVAGVAVQYRAAASLPGERWNRTLVPAVLLGYSALFALSAAAGRICLGFTAAQASRYSTFLIPGFLSLYFSLLALPTARVRKPALIALFAFLIPAAVWIPKGADRLAGGKRAWRECYLRTHDIDQCDASARFVIYPDPQRTHLKEKLNYLEANRLSMFSGQ